MRHVKSGALAVTRRCVELRELGFPQADIEEEMRKNAGAYGLAALSGAKPGSTLPLDAVYRAGKMAHAYACAGGWVREER